MKYLNHYLIPFVGLSIGRHEFKFEADRQFFSCFESSEIHEGNVTITVYLDKKSTHLELDFHLEGTVKVMCDRCIEMFDQPVESEDRLIVKFGTEEFENTDEILVLPHGAHEVSIAQPVYEFINLAVPPRRVHPEGGCNPEILKHLEKYKSDADDDDDFSGDPRWDALKDIKLN